jgi:hypothetical protein
MMQRPGTTTIWHWHFNLSRRHFTCSRHARRWLWQRRNRRSRCRSKEQADRG